MDSDSDSRSGQKHRIVTPTYTGPDRRESQAEKTDITSINAVIRFQGVANSVWDWQPEKPRRRAEDPPVNIMECLKLDELTMLDDETPKEQKPPEGYDPYGRSS